jgi:hypothetical protein
MVLSEKGKVPNNRRVASESLLNGPDGDGMLGFCCLKNACNMDPMAFYQPFLRYSLYLVEHFGFTLPETMLAIEELPDTAYFFCAAAEAFLP